MATLDPGLWGSDPSVAPCTADRRVALRYGCGADRPDSRRCRGQTWGTSCMTSYLEGFVSPGGNWALHRERSAEHFAMAPVWRLLGHHASSQHPTIAGPSFRYCHPMVRMLPHGRPQPRSRFGTSPSSELGRTISRMGAIDGTAAVFRREWWLCSRVRRSDTTAAGLGAAIPRSAHPARSSRPGAQHRRRPPLDARPASRKARNYARRAQVCHERLPGRRATREVDSNRRQRRFHTLQTAIDRSRRLRQCLTIRITKRLPNQMSNSSATRASRRDSKRPRDLIDHFYSSSGRLSFGLVGARREVR